MHRPRQREATVTERNWFTALCAAGLLVAVALAYRGTTAVPFLLDDEINIVGNESIRRLGAGAFWPRTEVYTGGRPLLNFSFALNYAVGGMNPRGYHLANLAIHAAAALALFGLVRRILLLPTLAPRFGRASTGLALAAALWWALHPLQTGAVTYLSQRAESLMGLAYMATAYFFLRATQSPARRWRILAVVTCGAGMLVKEVMVTAPLALLLLDRTLISGTLRAAWNRHGGLHLALASTWLLLLAVLLLSRLHDRGVGYGFAYSWHEYLRLESMAIVRYLRLALLPFGLVFDFGEEVPVPGIAPTLVSLAAIGVLAALACLGLLRRHPVALLPAWFLVVLAPTSSVVPVAGQPVAENRLYLPLAAFAVGVSLAGYRLAGRRMFPLTALAGIALGALTLARNNVFATELSIWADTVQKRPGSSRAQSHYGNALLRAGRVDDAMRHLTEAIRIQPNHYHALVALGTALMSKQQIAEAIRVFEAATQLKPNEPVAHNNLGTALFQAGRRSEALEHYQRALQARPSFLDARLNTGIVLAHLGRTAEALGVFEQMVRDHPDHQGARDNLRQLRAALNGSPRPP
jgi:tetratricopeptide (TPR) repeat protein